jgi:hypothetical protein
MTAGDSWNPKIDDAATVRTERRDILWETGCIDCSRAKREGTLKTLGMKRPLHRWHIRETVQSVDASRRFFQARW